MPAKDERVVYGSFGSYPNRVSASGEERINDEGKYVGSEEVTVLTLKWICRFVKVREIEMAGDKGEDLTKEGKKITKKKT